MENYATHLRLGKLTGTGREKRQKQVDILLAVDALNHAFRRNMGRVVLLTGDQDFTPVVRALVDMGLYVTVAGDRTHTSKELIHAADHYIPLTVQSYNDFTSVANRTGGFPAISNGTISPEQHKLLRTGSIAGVPCLLYENRVGHFWLQFNHPEQPKYFGNADQGRLLLFCELHLGEVQWD